MNGIKPVEQPQTGKNETDMSIYMERKTERERERMVNDRIEVGRGRDGMIP